MIFFFILQQFYFCFVANVSLMETLPCNKPYKYDCQAFRWRTMAYRISFIFQTWILFFDIFLPDILVAFLGLIYSADLGGITFYFLYSENKVTPKGDSSDATLSWYFSCKLQIFAFKVCCLIPYLVLVIWNRLYS
jgi:hypothetical protein